MVHVYVYVCWGRGSDGSQGKVGLERDGKKRTEEKDGIQLQIIASGGFRQGRWLTLAVSAIRDSHAVMSYWSALILSIKKSKGEREKERLKRHSLGPQSFTGSAPEPARKRTVCWAARGCTIAAMTFII